MARKPGLGKGLGALIPEGEVEEEIAVTVSSEGPLRRIPVNAIRPNPFQPRKSFSDDSLQSLASSVRELGVLQPLIVRPIDGKVGEFVGEPLGSRALRSSPSLFKMTSMTGYHSNRPLLRTFIA